MAEEKKKVQLYLDFDECIKSLQVGYSPEDLDEMKEIAHAEMQNGNVDWHEYMTYKRIDIHPDPKAAKMGRPI